MPESFKAFCRMVSFTAAKTSLIFVVSVACVRLRFVSKVASGWIVGLTEGTD